RCQWLERCSGANRGPCAWTWGWTAARSSDNSPGKKKGPSMSSDSAAADMISERARDYLRGKRVLVTGACGTVGKQLVRQLVERFEVGSLIGIDHNESELVFLEERYRGYPHARFLLCDIRDQAALLRETRRVGVLF